MDLGGVLTILVCLGVFAALVYSFGRAALDFFKERKAKREGGFAAIPVAQRHAYKEREVDPELRRLFEVVEGKAEPRKPAVEAGPFRARGQGGVMDFEFIPDDCPSGTTPRIILSIILLCVTGPLGAFGGHHLVTETFADGVRSSMMGDIFAFLLLLPLAWNIVVIAEIFIKRHTLKSGQWPFGIFLTREVFVVRQKDRSLVLQRSKIEQFRSVTETYQVQNGVRTNTWLVAVYDDGIGEPGDIKIPLAEDHSVSSCVSRFEGWRLDPSSITPYKPQSEA